MCSRFPVAASACGAAQAINALIDHFSQYSERFEAERAAMNSGSATMESFDEVRLAYIVRVGGLSFGPPFVYFMLSFAVAVVEFAVCLKLSHKLYQRKDQLEPDASWASYSLQLTFVTFLSGTGKTAMYCRASCPRPRAACMRRAHPLPCGAAVDIVSDLIVDLPPPTSTSYSSLDLVDYIVAAVSFDSLVMTTFTIWFLGHAVPRFKNASAHATTERKQIHQALCASNFEYVVVYWWAYVVVNRCWQLLFTCVGSFYGTAFGMPLVASTHFASSNASFVP